MSWTLPNAKDIRDNLRRLGEINPDLPQHVVEFGDFFADHMRDNSHLTPLIWVLAYRRANFLWLLDQRPSIAGHFSNITNAVHDSGFAAEAIREFKAG